MRPWTPAAAAADGVETPTRHDGCIAVAMATVTANTRLTQLEVGVTRLVSCAVPLVGIN